MEVVETWTYLTICEGELIARASKLGSGTTLNTILHMV